MIDSKIKSKSKSELIENQSESTQSSIKFNESDGSNESNDLNSNNENECIDVDLLILDDITFDEMNNYILAGNIINQNEEKENVWLNDIQQHQLISSITLTMDQYNQQKNKSNELYHQFLNFNIFKNLIQTNEKIIKMLEMENSVFKGMQPNKYFNFENIILTLNVQIWKNYYRCLNKPQRDLFIHTILEYLDIIQVEFKSSNIAHLFQLDNELKNEMQKQYLEKFRLETLKYITDKNSEISCHKNIFCKKSTLLHKLGSLFKKNKNVDKYFDNKIMANNNAIKLISKIK